jgi:hypothetical protein
MPDRVFAVARIAVGRGDDQIRHPLERDASSLLRALGRHAILTDPEPQRPVPLERRRRNTGSNGARIGNGRTITHPAVVRVGLDAIPTVVDANKAVRTGLTRIRAPARNVRRVAATTLRGQRTERK